MTTLPKRMPKNLGNLNDQKAIEVATLGAVIALDRVLNDVIGIAIKLATAGGVDNDAKTKAAAAQKSFRVILESHKTALNLSIDNLNQQIEEQQLPGRKAFLDAIRTGKEPT